MNLSRRNLLIGGAGALAVPGVLGAVVAPSGVEANAARDKSLWLTEIPALPKFPSFEGDREVDLVIIGAGYTGLSCAHYVKKYKPDWKVIVLESHEVGFGASSRNTGAVYAKVVGISDQGLPDRGLRRFRDFLSSEEIECDFAPSSTLYMSMTKNQAEEAKSNLKSGDIWIDADTLREQTSSNYYHGAVKSPGYFTIHPAKLVQGHLDAVMRTDVEIYERSAALKVKNGQPATVRTEAGTIRAKHVFIATNGYTPRLGFQARNMFPLHQYSLATRQLRPEEVSLLGLDQWSLRFEENTLPVTFSLTPSGRFFARMVLGYSAFNSGTWKDIEFAKRLTTKLFLQRYPVAADLGLDFGWHGVTGHTVRMRPMFEAVGAGNVHISAAYNGLGIMPAHNSGYLSACKLVAREDDDVRIMTEASDHMFMPGELYRSITLKPFMRAATPI